MQRTANMKKKDREFPLSPRGLVRCGSFWRRPAALASRLVAAVPRYSRRRARCRRATSLAQTASFPAPAVTIAAALSRIATSGDVRGHAFQIRVRCASLKTGEHPLQRLVRAESTVRQTADNEERHCERTIMRRALRQERNCLPIDALSHRFSTRFDFVAGRSRTATSLER